MELADILAERAVLCCTGVKTKRQLFEELAERAAEITGHDAEEIREAITNREELGSTGLGHGHGCGGVGGCGCGCCGVE